MSTHTPGPWRLQTGIRQDNGQTQTEVWSGPTSRIARVPHNEVFASNNAEANAEFIVRACNSHDEMVEALKAARLALNLLVFKDRDPVEWPHVERVAEAEDLADTAIAKAESN